MHYNIVLLHKKLLIALLSYYFLWKVMHYNIVLLHKKLLIALLSYYFLWKVMHYNVCYSIKSYSLRYLVTTFYGK